MSVEALMTQEVTLLRFTGEYDQSDTGDPAPIYDEMQTLMYMQPAMTRESREAVVDRNTGYGRWLGLGKADVDFHNWDKVRLDYLMQDPPLILDISTPVRPIPNPITRTTSHNEMDLLEIQ